MSILSQPVLRPKTPLDLGLYTVTQTVDHSSGLTGPSECNLLSLVIPCIPQFLFSTSRKVNPVISYLQFDWTCLTLQSEI